MTEHNRREEYWKFYDHAAVAETAHLRRTLIRLVREKPCPRSEGSNRGRPPIHSKEKLDFACLWMMADNQTYRKTESDMGEMRIPWDDEPVPDHTTLVRHMQTIPSEWMDEILAETARLCLAEVGGADAPLGADSSGTETTRYEQAERPDRDARGFVEKPQKIYWKYHITAVLGLQIILTAMATPGNVNDINMLVPMLDEIRRRGFDFADRLFHADKGYDAEYNYWMIFWTGMIPNIKQRRGATNRATPNRKKAARLFDQDEYRLRALIEGVFGAEESRRHQLHCRFVRTDNRLRFAKGRAIAWNVRALNRFEQANRLKVPIPSYGGQQTHAECA